MKLVVGLGNPGAEYQSHRHNIGFMVLDALLRHASGQWRSGFDGAYARVTLGTEPAILLKPLTYMNRSGQAVEPCASHFGIKPEDIIVIHDELDIPPGELRIKWSGGHGGHNGLRSIFAHLESRDFARIRCGIGRPPRDLPSDGIAAYVLSSFSADEAPRLKAWISHAVDAIEHILQVGVTQACNHFNRRKKPPSLPAKEAPDDHSPIDSVDNGPKKH